MHFLQLILNKFRYIFMKNSHFSMCTLRYWLLEDLTLSLTSINLSTGWPPSPQASAQVTYKSSSKPRARIFSGPISLSICLYLSPFRHSPCHMLEPLLSFSHSLLHFNQLFIFPLISIHASSLLIRCFFNSFYPLFIPMKFSVLFSCLFFMAMLLYTFSSWASQY